MSSSCGISPTQFHCPSPRTDDFTCCLRQMVPSSQSANKRATHAFQGISSFSLETAICTTFLTSLLLLHAVDLQEPMKVTVEIEHARLLLRRHNNRRHGQRGKVRLGG